MLVNKKSLKNKLTVFMIIFGALYVGYVTFFNYSFTSDHVCAYVTGEYFLDRGILYWISSGRFTAYITQKLAIIFNKINISIYENQYIIQFCLILMLAYSLTILFDVFSHYIDNKKWLYVILLISFYNPYFVEAFVYVAYEWGFGIILCTWAIRLFVKKKYILSTILLFLSVSTYQNFFSLYLIFLSGYIYLEYKGTLTKASFIEFVKMICITGVSAVSNIMIIKLSLSVGLIENEVKSISSGVGIFDRLERIIWAYYYTTGKCFGMLPKWSLLIVILGVCSIIMYALFKKKVRFADFVFFALIIGAINIAPISVIGIADKVGAVQRVVWPIFSTLSVLLMILYYFFPKTNFIGCKAIALAMGVGLMINIYFVNTCIVDFYCSNKMDEQTVMQIQAEIERYEKQNNMIIKNIAPYRIGKSQYYYDNLNLKYQKATYSHKMLYDEWSDVELINYLTGNAYEEVDISDDIIKRYFEDKSWNTYVPAEQLIFIEDTLYWAIY